MRFAVVGAGPIGLEFATHAQREGHDVVVFEATRVAEHVTQWNHVRLFTPWSMNTTPVGRSVLGNPPKLASTEAPTGREFVEEYLQPLAARLDVRSHSKVVSVSRPWKRKGVELGRSSRADVPFQLLVDGPDGEVLHEADVVVDCSGVFSDPSPSGPGGGWVPGERSSPVRYGPRSVADLGGQTVLLLGDGASAVTVLTDLLALTPAPTIHWVTPHTTVPGFVSPDDDPLPLRRQLVATAKEALKVVQHHPGRSLVYVSPSEVLLDDSTSLAIDTVLSCTGFRPDHSLSRELQVHLCWGSEGPMKLAAALLSAKGDGPADCLAGAPDGPDVLLSPEPNFFVLGNKSYGRRSDFLLGVGHQQVLDVMGLYSDAG